MVTGFITMSILSYQPCNIRKITMHIWVCDKYGIECSDELFLAPKQLHHSVHIIGYGKAILPGSSFRIGTSYLEWIERSLPIAIHPLSTEEFGRTVKHIDIVLGTFNIFPINIFFSHFLSHTRYAPIIISKFQQARYRFFLYVRRDKSISYIVIRSFFIIFRGNLHCIQCLFRIKSSNPLQISVSNNRYRMVSYHCSRLCGRKRPNRKFSGSIVNIQIRVHHIID